METTNINNYLQSRKWWIVLVLGIMLVLGGFTYWFWPVAGYAVASTLFGWLLIVAGVVQVIVGGGRNRPRDWGWWLCGGVVDMFIGFMLVRSLPLAESVFPYFMALLFIYWGAETLVSSTIKGRRFWWLAIINGLLLCVLGFFFIEGGLHKTIFVSSFLVSISFIYWGFTLTMASCEMKPKA